MTADRPRILLFDPKPGRTNASALRTCEGKDPRVVTDLVSSISEAVSALGRDGYDAVLLRLDEPGQVSLLLRIKASAPRTKLLALVTGEGRELGELARESGADGVVQAPPDPAAAPDAAVRSLQADDLIEQSRRVMAEMASHSDRMQELVARGQAIRAKRFDPARIPLSELRLLLVEDDEDWALLASRSFRKAGLCVPLATVRDGQEAVDYLAGKGPFGDRTRYPLPSLVLLDLRLPKKSGLEVLSWIRSRPEFSDLIVFVLTSSLLREDFDRALALGADFYFAKPPTLDGLLNLVGVAATKWGLIYKAMKAKRRP